MNGHQLIMDLTQEQGPGRETQVQPPIDVWVRFFDIKFSRLPTFRFLNQGRRRPRPEARPVVFHDHNWTVEIAGATPPRPAILRLQRVGARTFNYWVYRPGDPEFDHCKWFLANFPNPYRQRGRRWLII